MPGEDRKLKLLYLARYLMENTDAEHGVTVVFVELPNTVEGLVHINTLEDGELAKILF